MQNSPESDGRGSLLPVTIDLAEATQADQLAALRTVQALALLLEALPNLIDQALTRLGPQISSKNLLYAARLQMFRSVALPTLRAGPSQVQQIPPMDVAQLLSCIKLTLSDVDAWACNEGVSLETIQADFTARVNWLIEELVSRHVAVK